MLDKWDHRFLKLAHEVSTWSKDPSTKVGAVIVRPDRTIASLGFNGFPRGVPDHEDELLDREVKYARTLHAEVNAILTAKEPLAGFTIYVTPLHPCAGCASIIVQTGIKRVVAAGEINHPRWGTSFKLASETFQRAEVAVDLIDLCF